ncbi:DUF6225 family protein [Streptomyces sp. NPDC015345]|uniref:DUF6225 family protein n=1 Tax=Streptomyces sp. NPDC015345 TaxID=3364953 RepID=UPI0036F927C3
MTTDATRECRDWTVGELRAALTDVEDDLPLQVLITDKSGTGDGFQVGRIVSIELDAAQESSGKITQDEALLILADYSEISE